MKSHQINKGGNCALCLDEPAAIPLLIRLDWSLREPLIGEIDASLFLLAKEGKVRSDADFVFYNQKTTDMGQVRQLGATDPELNDGKAGFWVDIARIPVGVDRLAISLTYYGDESQKAPLQIALARSVIEIRDSRTQHLLVSYEFLQDIQEETALIVGEIYRHADGWKFRAIGQGFVGGLAALAAHFGVHLCEEPATEGVLQDVGVSLQTRRKRRSPHEMLAEQCQQVRKNLEGFMPQIKAACHMQENEARTRMILDRVFQDVFGYAMEHIKTEQNIQGRKADYVLTVEDQDTLVVEVKRAGMAMRERQIFQATSYGAYAGIRWALLTNLMDWQLYRISTGDKIEANQVFAISLKNGLDEESAYRLTLISAYGFSRKGLLEKLWLKSSTLSYERLAAAVLNQDVISKMRSILSKEAGVALTQEEVQAAIERYLLHLE